MSTEPVPPRPDAMHPVSEVPVSLETPRHKLAARPKATWRPWQALAVYLGAFLAGGIAALPVLQLMGNDDFGAIVSTVVAAAVILGVLVFWLQRGHPGWVDVLGVPKDWVAEVRAGVVFGIGLYPAVVFVVGLVLVVVFRVLSGHSVQAPEQISQHLPVAGTIVTIVYAIALAPLGEELFFRGVLFRAIRDRYGFPAGALGSAVAFGSIHYIPGPALDSLLLMTVMVFTGLGLAYIYERRGSIVAPIAAHVTFNAIGLALIYGLR
ncbi:MAG: lysostaphin resistance A-like protein [Solirubrobacterales bacterium]